VFLGPKDARDALRAGKQKAAYLWYAVWQKGDVEVVITLDPYYTSLDVATADLGKAVELLRGVKEEVGPVYDLVRVALHHGPYLLPRDEAFRTALIKATKTIEEELSTVREYRDELGRFRGVEGIMHTFATSTGPLYVVFPYPNGTAPDKAVAERLVRRFVEPSGFCENPLVVEFWPKTGFEPLPAYPQHLWPYAAVIGLL